MSVIIEPSDARWRFIETGKSSAFGAWFDDLEKAKTGDGRLLYGLRPSPEIKHTLNDLERILTCRLNELSLLVYQYCHWVRGLDALTGGQGLGWQYAAFCIDEPAKAASFKAHLSELSAFGSPAPGTDVTLHEKDLKIAYPDYEKPTFDIAYGRMPLLMAFGSLVMATRLNETMSRAFSAMFAQPFEHEAARPTVNHLVSEIGKLFDGELRSRQSMEKFEQLIGFLSQRGFGAEAADDDEEQTVRFDDASLLNYWLGGTEANTELTNIRLYRTAFEDLINVVHALNEGEILRRSQHSVVLGADFESGEFDIADTRQMTGQHSDYFSMAVEEALGKMQRPAVSADEQGYYQSPLEHFFQSPFVETNLISKTDRQRLHMLMLSGPLATGFSRSLLRSQVYGYIQSELSNAPPRKQSKDMVAQYLASLHAPVDGNRVKDVRNYGQQLRQYRELRERIELRIKKIGEMIERHEDLDLDNAAMPEDEDWDSVMEKLRKLRAETAQLNGNRVFAEAEDNEELRSILEEALPWMAQISFVIRTFLEAIEGEDQDIWNQKTDEDKQPFEKGFSNLYGEIL